MVDLRSVADAHARLLEVVADLDDAMSIGGGGRLLHDADRRRHEGEGQRPMTRSTDQPDVAPEVRAYIEAVPADQRPLFERLHRLVLDALPGARVVISYNMPAYVVEGGRVSLSTGRAWISLSTTVPEPVAAFKAKHPRFKTGRVSIQFPPDADLPEDDIRALVQAATGA